MTMIVCVILGMGLPTTANYVVTATIAAPILINNFEVPVIAAHMFVFFFGILADITPPVCLAAYAGAGIAGANPMKTGVTAVKLAIAAFLIPFVFVLEPSLLLQGTIAELVPALATLVLGMMVIAAGLAGYFFGRTSALERALLLIGGVLMVYPHVVVSVAGLVLAVIAVVLRLIRRRGSRGDSPSVADREDASDGAASTG
ncbi:TRAP transporter large permease subunit [Brachybacterium sp. GPGPB12]|uniref:TRAP transporter large permease subunit n=1 Tax=Brachybacterium sp. GPGPB12 TaxID=3023517 RepID=UPI0031345C12